MKKENQMEGIIYATESERLINSHVGIENVVNVTPLVGGVCRHCGDRAR